MNSKFRRLIESLEPSFQKLITMEPVSAGSLPVGTPKAGIYLFSEGDSHLYVGRTNRMRRRLQQHCQPSAGHNAATFAFLLARKLTDNLKASYTEKNSRSALESDPKFKNAFLQQKERVRNMHVRFVSQPDPLRQALLEMYVAISLGTPYNDFDNH